MDSEFGHWLAGFTAGEAWFSLRVTNSGTTYSGVYGISLRDDDADIIYEIQRQLGFGNISRRIQQHSYLKASPQVTFEVSRIDDCLKIIELFEEYPLRGKKETSFKIWAKAIKHISETRIKNQYDKNSSGRDNELLAELKKELMLCNMYSPMAEIAILS